MIDINTTAAALQNAAGVAGLMNPPGTQDMNKMALQNAFARTNMLLQNQMENQRQATLLSAEAARQTSAQEAAKGLQGSLLEAESARQQKQIEAAASLESVKQTAENIRQKKGILGGRETALEVEGQHEQAEIDAKNTLEAERIRADPLTGQLGIDPSKYDPRKPEDNAALIKAYQAANTPEAKRELFTSQAERLTDSLSKAKNQLMAAVSGPEGSRAQVLTILSNSDVTDALLKSHNTSSTPGSLSKLSIEDLNQIRSMAMTPPSADHPNPAGEALSKLNGWMTSATKGAMWGTNDPALIGTMTNARNQAIGAVMDPNTAPPGVRNLLQSTADLSALRNNSIQQLGQYSPRAEDIARATGSQAGGALTDMLTSKGAGVTPGTGMVSQTSAPRSAGLAQPDISKLPPSPGELPVTGLDPDSASIVNQRNLQIRQQNYDTHVTQPLQQLQSQRAQIQAQIQQVKSGGDTFAARMNGSSQFAQSGAPPKDPATILSNLGQMDAALASKQAEIQSHQAAFASVAAGQGLPAGYGQPAPQNGGGVMPSPQATPTGVNPYQSSLSQFMQSAAYGSPNN